MPNFLMFSVHFYELLFLKLESQLCFNSVNTCTDSFIKVNISSPFRTPELIFCFSEFHLDMKLDLTVTGTNGKT